jgi:hypothetical protein
MGLSLMVSVKHSDHTGRYAVLYPAIAEAARRCAAERVGLISTTSSITQNHLHRNRFREIRS